MKKWWIVGAVVVVAVIALFVGPRIYASFESSDPAATVSTEGARAAEGDLDGEWTVTPGSDSNPTSAGYTVAEVLNGADVTVVGTTRDVSGSATVPLTGELTLKGQTRPVTVDASVLRDGANLVASGGIPVTWTDFGVEPPSLGFVTVEPTGTVDFLVTLAKN